jgi:two-component system CheB/CheR fusion protein
LSHELRTPLTPVLLTVEALQGDRRVPSELGALDLAASDSWIRGDAARLEQVFWNLLSNALKFTGPGGSVRVRTWNEPGGRLRVEVNDTGMGIEPAVLPHVFNAFEQGGGHVTRRFGGLGLGLAISKNLVELHGGSIEARSEGTGRGTAFTVTLDTVQPAAEGAGPEASPDRETGRGLRLLLVEDHADTAEAMAELLQESGHRVTVARNLAEALSLADAAATGEEGGFDLVVSDLGLPDGSGLDLMRELARRHGLRGIALSGYGTEQDVRDSLAAGFERHLVKPVGVRAIEAAIREVT